jgi:hypothetical protein
MAIEYDLDCATHLSALDVALPLAETGRETGLFDASVTGERLVEEGAVTRLGTWVRAVTPRPPQPWNPVVTMFGFTPTVDVRFRMAKGVEVADQQDDMIRLVAPLLTRVSGDAVLHYQYEVVWLLRKDGKLSLSERDDIWRPRRLALMAQPYHRQTHSMDLD